MTDTISSTGVRTQNQRLTARALLLGDRLDVAGLERSDVLSTAPLAFRAGQEGFVALFRYGVAVLVGLTPLEEDEVIRGLRQRIQGEFSRHEEETAIIEISPDRDDQIPPGGPIYIKHLSTERLVVIADALSKSAALARDEREAAAVFDLVEPAARHLAEKGRRPPGRREILKHVGHALLVRQRVSGRVAVEEKPDVLWDRPDLERLYARLEDEYELKERATALHRKLEVIGDTAQALTDLIDTERSLRLELIIVLLIVFEIFITFYQMAIGYLGGH
ncbi:RMD1 family protein [Microvirga makkahensis]|uniref:RMD1 family protein n=1 Tax=Microvirga makkahensis TaxID=1128670 RepID=A0A7X3SMG9_9HYPH|nr:RMD1 family protein [Microvirga makkahensis]MXQ10113.1 RMD1 family protein [Microvirga makkahensis]